MKISHSTKRGEQAILNFIGACYKRGLLIARPVLFDPGYDLIIHNPHTNGMWRVQVKTAYRDRDGFYLASLHRPRGCYPTGMIHRFIFEKPDESGFGILDGARLDQATGLRLKDRDWERWELFDLRRSERASEHQRTLRR